MAIETGAIFKRLYFDGESSGDYGVYITGAGTFNAPERDIEMVSIPGRNGALALDRGRFENIEVTYKAGLFGVDEADFAEAISDFRNFLCSRFGYVRLEDDYNPDEYRMAVYKSGLDVKADVLKAGEFDLVFDCKPQRWLKSGETAVTVASGDILTNPTLFEASPLLEVDGYGDIAVNGYGISLIDGFMGQIILAEKTSPVEKFLISGVPVNNGDNLSYEGVEVSFIVSNSDAIAGFTNIYNITSNANKIKVTTDGTFITIVADYPNIDTTLGSTGTLQNINISFEAAIMYSGTERRMKLTLYSTIAGVSGGIEVTNPNLSTSNVSGYPSYSFTPARNGRSIRFEKIFAFSTVSYTAYTMYIDCDIGEAYMIYNGEVVNLNPHIDLGSDLPKLASGANTITFDNTITSLKVTPRWWKV